LKKEEEKEKKRETGNFRGIGLRNLLGMGRGLVVLSSI
jgi:hypothetical protein